MHSAKYKTYYKQDMINTSNPLEEDNIFLAGFYVNGEVAIITDLEPVALPESGILTLMEFGSWGVTTADRTLRRRS